MFPGRPERKSGGWSRPRIPTALCGLAGPRIRSNRETRSPSRPIGLRTDRTQLTLHELLWRMDAASLRVLQVLRPRRHHRRPRESEKTVKTTRAHYSFAMAALCALLSASVPSALTARVTQAPTTAPLPRLPGGRPNLQGLWLTSAGGFQGLFIGSLDGTNLAAGGARGGGTRGGPAPRRYEYTPEAEAEK